MGLFDTDIVQQDAQTRKKSSERSGIINTQYSKDLKQRRRDEKTEQRDRLRWGTTERRSDKGRFSMNAAMTDWISKKREHSPYMNRSRNLASSRSWRHFLTKAGEAKKGKSSKDTTKESYSTLETRSFQPLSFDAKSGYQELGAQSASADRSQMFGDSNSNLGSVRRTRRRVT